MGFNKRYFSWDRLQGYAATSTYESFETYLMNPDACIFEDERSHKFWSKFCESTKEERITIYNQLKDGSWK